MFFYLDIHEQIIKYIDNISDILSYIKAFNISKYSKHFTINCPLYSSEYYNIKDFIKIKKIIICKNHNNKYDNIFLDLKNINILEINDNKNIINKLLLNNCFIKELYIGIGVNIDKNILIEFCKKNNNLEIIHFGDLSELNNDFFIEFGKINNKIKKIYFGNESNLQDSGLMSIIKNNNQIQIIEFGYDSQITDYGFSNLLLTNKNLKKVYLGLYNKISQNILIQLNKDKFIY